MGIQRTENILTEQQFNASPLKDVISYADYFKQALKFGSTFTFARLLKLQEAKDTSDKIKDSVKGWALEKEAKKDAAEEEYYAALAQMKAMEKAQEKSRQDLEYALANYGENSFEYNNLAEKYRNSIKTSSDAEINWKIASDKYMSANMSAFKAFNISQGLN